MNTRRVLVCLSAAAIILSGCGTDPVQPDTSPRVWHVPGDWPTLAAAADTAHSGETIELAAGVYREHGIVLEAGVNLRGPSDKSTPAILDGEGLGRILHVAPDTVSTPHPFSLSNLAKLEFRNGAANERGGGALYIQSAANIAACLFTGNTSTGPGGAVNILVSDVNIAACTFDDNHADAGSGEGGALAATAFTHQSIAIAACTFTHNSARSAGGAVYIFGPMQIEASAFISNTAQLGGAAMLGGSSPKLSDCLFRDNLATVQGGTDASGHGGALYLPGGDAEVLRCEFAGNRALLGSAVYGFNSSRFMVCVFAENACGGSGTVRWAGHCSPEFLNCDFLRNAADYGGAFSTMGGVTAVFTDCDISENTAGAGGAGIFEAPDVITLNACRITGNAVASQGGAFACLSGPGITVGVLNLNACTVSGNSAEVSGGALFLGFEAESNAVDTVFSGNLAPAYAGGFVGLSCVANLTCCTLTEQEFGGQGIVMIDDSDCGD